MKTLLQLIVALAFVTLVGCGTKDETMSTTITVTTDIPAPAEDESGFFAWLKGAPEAAEEAVEEAEEKRWRLFGWFRDEPIEEAAEEVAEETREWRWFGWFRDEPVEEIVEEVEEETRDWRWFRKDACEPVVVEPEPESKWWFTKN